MFRDPCVKRKHYSLAGYKEVKCDGETAAPPAVVIVFVCTKYERCSEPQTDLSHTRGKLLPSNYRIEMEEHYFKMHLQRMKQFL